MGTGSSKMGTGSSEINKTTNRIQDDYVIVNNDKKQYTKKHFKTEAAAAEYFQNGNLNTSYMVLSPSNKKNNGDLTSRGARKPPQGRTMK